MSIIITKHSTVSGIKPIASQLEIGELAINTEDGIIFFKNTAGEIKEFHTVRPYPKNLPSPKTFLGKILEIIYMIVQFIVLSIVTFLVKTVLCLI